MVQSLRPPNYDEVGQISSVSGWAGSFPEGLPSYLAKAGFRPLPHHHLTQIVKDGPLLPSDLS